MRNSDPATEACLSEADQQRALAERAALTTFLFTDIEGSSERYVRFPGFMQSAVAVHDDILRHCIEANDGIVFRTGGDAFFATFASPSSAVRAAMKAQAQLASQDWSAVGDLRVRMALHYGPAQRRGDDFYGPGPNCCGKLLALAHGKQVLATSVVAELVYTDPALARCFMMIGAQSLDDKSRAFDIYQILVAGQKKPTTLRVDHLRPKDLAYSPTVLGTEPEIALSDRKASSFVHHHGRLPPAYTGHFIAQARREICIVGFSLRSFVGYFVSRPANEIREPVRAALARRVQMQWLFLDPESDAGRAFAAERGGESCLDEIRATIRLAKELRVQLKAAGATMELRTYDLMPFGQAKRIDPATPNARLLLYPYLPTDRRPETPYFEIGKKANPNLFEVYSRAIDNIVDASRPIE
jgi:class 3 adenylate cyclase